MFENMITFPFVPIADLLRMLSLSGAIGNAVALLLYVVICLLPVALFFVLRRMVKADICDVLLLALSVLLFMIMYQLINPKLLNGVVGQKVLACMTLYSVICTYLILKVIAVFHGATSAQWNGYCIKLLWCLQGVFLLGIVQNGVFGFLEAKNKLELANTGFESDLSLSIVFVCLGILVEILPYITSMVVMFFSIQLVKAYGVERYSEATILATKKLCEICKVSLILTVLSAMVFNILQFLYASKLHQINSNIHVPIFSILFLLVILVVSQMMVESKALQEDSESII